jgi:hypothetical protein
MGKEEASSRAESGPCVCEMRPRVREVRCRTRVNGDGNDVSKREMESRGDSTRGECGGAEDRI